jgi:hypothetical protein
VCDACEGDYPRPVRTRLARRHSRRRTWAGGTPDPAEGADALARGKDALVVVTGGQDREDTAEDRVVALGTT